TALDSHALPLHALLLFFFNDTAPPELYTLSLHDALPISVDLHQLVPELHDLPGDRHLGADDAGCVRAQVAFIIERAELVYGLAKDGTRPLEEEELVLGRSLLALQRGEALGGLQAVAQGVVLRQQGDDAPAGYGVELARGRPGLPRRALGQRGDGCDRGQPAVQLSLANGELAVPQVEIGEFADHLEGFE